MCKDQVIAFVKSSFCRACLINADRFAFPALFIALVAFSATDIDP